MALVLTKFQKYRNKLLENNKLTCEMCNKEKYKGYFNLNYCPYHIIVAGKLNFNYT